MTSAPLVQKLWIFWLKDASLADYDNLPSPQVIAQDNVDRSLPTTRPFFRPSGPCEATMRSSAASREVPAVIDPRAPSLPTRSARRAAAMPPRSGLADLLARSPRGLAQGAVVSSLQAGPRALAQRRQMATSVPARVTQRYTVVEAGQQRPNYWQGLGAALRVADDGKMALKHVDGGPKDAPDYQHFYVTADIIQGSQQALTVTGSAFSIAQGGGTLVGSAPGKQISAQYGIDESALPEVGQGFGIIRGGQGGQGGQGGREGMGHFAPVVAVSGQDRVTLENDVNQTADREKQAVGEINPNWYSRMFGSVKKRWYGNQDQTFWGEAKKHEKAEYGDRPLVASLGSRPRED